MLLDAAGLYFRAFFGVPDRRTDPEAPPTNAVRGFLDMVATLVQAHRPDGLVACWDDDWRPAFRVAAVPSYKTHRLAPGATDEEATPPELALQVPLVVDALAALGIARVGSPGYEADDVIGTLVEREGGRRQVDVVTGDRDLFQLVRDPSPGDAGVRVLYTARGGVRDADVVDESYLRERYGVRDGDGYADLAILRGDPSDGLPGVPGVGEKTAARLLETYGDLAGLIRAIDDGDPHLKGAQRAKLVGARGYLEVAPTVVRVARDCPLRPLNDALPTEVADARLLSELASGYGLTAPINRVLTALGITS